MMSRFAEILRVYVLNLINAIDILCWVVDRVQDCRPLIDFLPITAAFTITAGYNGVIQLLQTSFQSTETVG